MVTGAAEVTVVGGSFLFAMVQLMLLSMLRAMIFRGRRSCTRSIQTPDRAVTAARLSSVASHSGSNRPIWLFEAAIRRGLYAPGAHDRVPEKSLGVIHVLTASRTAEHRLPKKSHQEMSGVLAAPRSRQNLAAQFGRSKLVIELADKSRMYVYFTYFLHQRLPPRLWPC